MAKSGMNLDFLWQDDRPENILKYLISVDTSRGSEIRLAHWLGQALEREGIAARVYEPFPGRGSLVARLPGGKKPPLVLLSHLDTAPAEEPDWPFPPFSGTIDKNEVRGRGAIDCKGLAVVHFMAFRAMGRLKGKLNRDLYLVSTAGEEEGGHVGLAWLLGHLPELRRKGYVLAEGGGMTLQAEEGPFLLCQVGEKGKLKLSLKPAPAEGLLQEIAQTTLKTLDPGFSPPLPAGLEKKLDMAAMTANRCFVRDSEVTFEILPGVDIEKCWNRFCRAVHSTGRNSHVAIQDWTPGTLSNRETALYSLLERESSREKNLRLTPFITPGYSDNRFFRRLGTTVYGLQPLLPDTKPGWIHGKGERIGISSLHFGMKILFSTIAAFCL